MVKPRSCRRKVILVLMGLWAAVLSGFGASTDSPIDASLYSALKWRLVGPFRGGRAITATGVSSQPDTYYFGAVAGGVWKTTNGGITWRPIFDGQPVSSIGAIAVAPSDPNVIYVGTGEADMRSDISFGDGVYKSVDAGRTWRHIGLEETRAIGRILVDPHDPRVVLVAALGRPYGPNRERGVYRSADGGDTWQKVLHKDENTGAVDLGADPETGQIIYASLWQARRPPWSVYGPIEGPGGGLYKSTDGGVHWTQLGGNGLPEGELHRIGISVAPGGRRVYALIDTAKAGDRGLYRSDDAGQTWKHVSADSRIDGRAWYFGGVFVDPQNADTVYVGNTALYRSLDGGASFAPFKGSPGGDDYHFLWINPADSRRMILASDQGTGVSVDGGETWSSWYNQPTAQLYHVTTDDQFPYHLYGAQQDSGSVEILSRSDAREISSRDWQPTAGGEAGYIAPDPVHPELVLGGDTFGSLGRLWRSTSQEQNIQPSVGRASSYGRPPGCHPGDGFRFNWTSPLVFSARDPQALYFSSQVLWKSLDDGSSWQALSSNLTRPAAGPQPPPEGGPADFEKVTGCGVIYTIAPSPLNAEEIWAGTDDGLIQLTRDGGKTWKNVTPPDLGPWSRVSLIEASHFDPGSAYAAIDRHRLDDSRPHILRTHDYGATWAEAVAGIPEGSYVHVVREDPERQGLLYAGTESGVLVSFNDGNRWQSLQLNLPTAPVHDLAVHGDDLVAATHGRSFWILDDVTPLRQLNAQVAAADAYLLKPAPAIRLRPRPFDGTPLPAEEPAGQNPPAGAMIDYELRSEPSGDVRIEILDAGGRPVRQFSSADKPAQTLRPPVVTANWLQHPAVLTKKAGMNRFVWDLRYPPPPASGDADFFSPRGLMVLPGDYQVRLTVNGRSSVQPLKVELDPRVKTSRADLESQFRFQQQVIGALTNARNLNRAVRDAYDKLEALSRSLQGKPATGDLSAQVDALAGKVRQLSGRTGPGGETADAGSAPGDVARILSALTQVFAAADGADAAPTAACVAGAHEAQDKLYAARAAWDVIKKQDVPKLNQLLRASGFGKVDVMDEL